MAVGTDRIGKQTDVDIEAKCPVCGDSQKSKNKKRLHLYEKNGIVNVNCFNGDCLVHNKTMYGFLLEFFPDLLPQYKRETFQKQMDNLKKPLNDGLSSFKKEKIKEKPVRTFDLSPFMGKLEDHPEGIEYLKGRLIDYDKKFGDWYFGTQNMNIDGTFYRLIGSVILPLYYDGEMYGFYSRSISNKDFVTYMIKENIGFKVWNWFNVDLNEPVYIFEGIFDAISSGKKNVIALMGAKLPEERLKEIKYPVFCLDLDKTGFENALIYAKSNHNCKIFIQPTNICEKDMNEIKKNHREINIPEMIDLNSFTGIQAEIQLKVRRTNVMPPSFW